MNSKQVLKRVFNYVGRYKIYLFLSMALAVVSVAGTLYVPVLIGNIIDFIVDKGFVNFDKIIPVLIQVCIIIGVVALATERLLKLKRYPCHISILTRPVR